MIKGTALHEILNLPPYWAKIGAVPDNGMQVTRHAYGRHPRQYFLRAVPPANGPDAPRHAVVFFHGGAWRFGTPEQFIGYAKFFTGLGYTTFLPSYRRIPAHHFGHLHEDLVALLGHIGELTNLAGSWPGLIAGGMSAGGHMAAILAQDSSVWRLAGLSQSPIAGLIACGAPLDLDKLSNSPVLLRLAGRRGSARYQQANPAWQAQQAATIPPVLCIHGTADGLVPVDCAHSFARFVKEKPNANLTFHLINGGTHLDAGRWVFREDAERAQLVRWLRELG
ncbi:MAG: alpha/beta hydrolase [Saprospiraceae bacterium]|nr:alpha/beta hydrolase [Saprospiraceae bacterium]